MIKTNNNLENKNNQIRFKQIKIGNDNNKDPKLYNKQSNAIFESTSYNNNKNNDCSKVNKNVLIDFNNANNIKIASINKIKDEVSIHSNFRMESI